MCNESLPLCFVIFCHCFVFFKTCTLNILCIQFSMCCTHWMFPFIHYFFHACQQLAFAAFRYFSTYCIWLFIFTIEENSIKFWSGAFGVCFGCMLLTLLSLGFGDEDVVFWHFLLMWEILSASGCWLYSIELCFFSLRRASQLYLKKKS